MPPQRWIPEKNIEFIEVYKQHECLWDPKHPNYKNREAREVAYLAMMKAMEMDGVREVIKRIRILRNTYNNEIAKTKNNEHYVSKISWLSHLDFLMAICIRERKKIETPNADQVNLDDSDSESSEEEEESVVVNTPVEKKRKIMDPLIEEVNLRDKVSQPFSNDNDEFGLFGRTVAEQLRQLPLGVALETEEMILSTIRKQRIRVLSSTSSQQELNFPMKYDVDS